MKGAGSNISDAQEAHHIIPCEFACWSGHPGHPLVEAAQDLGWSPNNYINGRALFHNVDDAAAAGLPSHWTSHPQYNKLIEQSLNDAWTALPANPSADDIMGAIYGVIDEGNALINHFGWVAPGAQLP